MGILDQAIREHLELKRSRGATDSELQRMEDEAFGPPSRPGEPDFPEQEGETTELSGNGVGREEPVVEATEAPPPAEGEQDQGEPEPELGDLDLELDEEVPADEPPLPETSPESREPQDTAAPEAPIESLDTVEHPLPEEVEDETDDERSAEDDPGEHDPGEHDPDEADSDEDEDVLADTPEFLKDAPEDDELWFEQGKPKDFDF
jgi:hypothetical protein